MKTNIDRYDFAGWFAEHRPNDFSPIGRMELYDMLTAYEDDTGEEIEFDPIAFTCEYAEYENMEEFWQDYDKEDYPDEESIMNATFYWAFENGDSFIIQKF
jgi:hypothetical protein|tara:strand:+ start:369 stop:671 length:303 start_codon:yes stop_codon:yes gene_type:complete